MTALKKKSPPKQPLDNPSSTNEGSPSWRQGRPPHLEAGNSVALIAPAFHFNNDLFNKGRQFLERQYKVQTSVAPGVLERDGYFAGSIDRRLNEIYEALVNPDIHGVLAIRGGYGCADLYESLIAKLRKHRGLKPKIVAGYSDLTIILNGLYQDLGWITFHSPVIVGRPFREPVPLESETFHKSLFTTQGIGSISDPQMIALHEGEATAPLVGGCLSLLVASLGTSYEIETKNKILFIEEIGEAPYRVDRMLTQLKHAGKLSGIKGIIFGQMVECNPHSTAMADVDVLTAIKRCVSGLKVPIVYNFPAGHGTPQATIPIGVPVDIRCFVGRRPPEVTFVFSGTK